MAEGSIGEQEIANRKYIGPNKTGDNIDADRVANYIWDGSAWIRQTAAAGGGATEYTDGDATTLHPVGGIPVFNKAGVITAVSDTNPLPTTATITGGGDASAANQTTEIAKLTSIDGKITAVNTGAVVVSSSALPTGAATSAKQPALGTAGTPSADVITVQGKTSMTPLLTDASATTQPVSATSLPLPSGASTSAKQDTGNTSVASIDTKTPALGQALAAGSVPVVLPSAQITTLTPPAAITGFATSTKQSDGTQKTQVVDGSGNVIGATSNALDVNIKSGSSAGTQYADGAVRGTSTGNLMMVDDGTNIQSAAGTSGGLLKVDLSGTASNSTAVKTDGSGVTQPVSGTVTANAGTGTMAVSSTNLDVALSTRLKPADTLTKVATVDTITNVVHVDDNAGSITVDATSLPLPTLAATSTKQSDGSQKTQVVDGAGNVIGATSNALDVNIKSGSSADTQYTDGGTPPLHPVGTVPVYDSAGTWKTVSATNKLPVATGLTQPTTPSDTQPVSAASLPLPAGAATSAKQDTGNTSVASIDTKTPALGQALAASSVPVVLTAAQVTTLTPPAAITGFATSAKQDTGNTSLSSIDGKITAVNTGAVVVSSSALPTGAATSAKQPALGTAGTSSADVLTVQGIASMTALKTDGSGVTQPVSGTFWQATQPVSLATNTPTLQAGSAIVGKVGIDQTTDGTTNKVYVGNIPHVVVDTAPSTAVTNAGTFAVQTTPTAPTTIFNGKKTVTTAGTRVTLAASQAVKSVVIKALAANTGIIYVGDTAVASTNGFALAAGEILSLDIANLNTVNLDCSVSGEGVSFVATN